MLELLLSILVRYWLSLFLLLSTAYLANNYFNRGLQKYPGPLLASLTDWWRFFDVLGRRPETTQRKLHKQHGDIVRLGPNVLSFANPQALRTIYGIKKGFIKSDFYPVQQAMSKGERLPSLFSTTDDTYHAKLRKCVNGAFSMTALVQYEPFVDSVTEKFLDQTEALFVSKNAICDFAEWLQYLAFDVIGQITYGKPHGFIDTGEDVDGMIGYLGSAFSYVAPIGQLPVLDLLFLKNPLIRLLDKFDIRSSTFPIVAFVKARMSERLSEMPTQNAADSASPASGRGDLLSMFLKAKEDQPHFFHDGRVLTMAVSMAFAGSETTAISLAAVFYYLLKNRRCYEKLMAELDQAVKSSLIEKRGTGLVSWFESQRLPYLDACIKEAFRLHPAVGLPLERIVPTGGAKICGEMIPGGTIVGCNAWIIHRRPEIFGSDVEIYRPERWIEADKESRKLMEGTMFHFGMGARTCIGKNISLIEVYKIVPAFLRRFEIEFAFPEKEWILRNAWFVKQKNFYTTFKPRTVASIRTTALEVHHN